MQTFTPNIESRVAAIDSNVGKHGHHDVIHDVAFDYYGRRMATCSSDHTVRVWDYNDRAEKWDVKEFRPHYGPVWRVCWAPPEYGHLLATCSFDRSASIWEEVSTVTGPPANVESGLKGENSAKSSAASEIMTPDFQQRSANSDRNVRPSFSAQDGGSARRTISTSRPPPLQNLVTDKPNKSSTDGQLNKSSNSEAGHGRQSMVEGILSKPVSLDSQSGKQDHSTRQIEATRSSAGAVGSTPRDGRSRLVTGNSTADSHGGVTWMRRSFLTDASGSVTDCEFAPRHVGSLQLAICSADGKLRVYESDTQNLQTWQLLCDLDCRIGALSAVSWCPARLSAPMIACGANEDRNVGLTQADRDRSSSFIGLNQAASGAPLEHIAVFENVESENGRTSKWKQVVLVNVDALFKRSSAASTQTQSQTRLNLSRADSSSSGRVAAASKRTDSKLAAGRFEVGSCHNDSGFARVEGESQAGRSADNYIEPVCSVPVHDLAFAPNFGRAFQLLALATSSGVRIIKMTPLGGANFDSIYSLQPASRPDGSTLVNNANNGNGNFVHRNSEFSSESASMSASTVLHGSENAQLESRLRNLFSDSSMQPLVTESNQPHSRKASTLSNTGSSSAPAPLDLFTLATTSADGNVQPNAFGLRTDDATRYACECLLDDAAGKRVWRVAWNVLGSRLAASFDDGHVVLYANDPTTQRWTVTQVVETASTCHATVAVAVADECLAPPLSSSVPNTILHPSSTVTSHPSAMQQVMNAVYNTAHQLGVPSHPPGMMRVDSFTQALHSEWTMQHTHSVRTQTITSSSRNGANAHPYYE